MYPYQSTPMGNPNISPISCGYLWVIIPKNAYVYPHKYHGYTVRGTPNCPLNQIHWDDTLAVPSCLTPPCWSPSKEICPIIK